MLWSLVTLPFRLLGYLLRALGRTGRFVMTSLLGTLIVATIGFLLGMKYMEQQDRKGPRGTA